MGAETDGTPTAEPAVVWVDAVAHGRRFPAGSTMEHSHCAETAAEHGYSGVRRRSPLVMRCGWYLYISQDSVFNMDSRIS
jgi:hypothetical protein